MRTGDLSATIKWKNTMNRAVREMPATLTPISDGIRKMSRLPSRSKKITDGEESSVGTHLSEPGIPATHKTHC
jgi:hypothetical protein